MKRLLLILSLFFAVPAMANITIVCTVTAAVTAAPTSSVTTTAISTTGTEYFEVFVADNQGAAAGTLSDNQGNTWILDTSVNDGAVARCRAYHCNAPTTNASHTFSYVSAGATFPAIFVYGLAGTKVTNPFDRKQGAGLAAATSGQPGSITPSVDGCIILSGVNSRGSAGSPNAPTVASPLTRNMFQNFFVNAHFASATGSYVQGAAAAINPLWTYQASFTSALIVVSIKPENYTPTNRPNFFPWIGKIKQYGSSISNSIAGICSSVRRICAGERYAYVFPYGGRTDHMRQVAAAGVYSSVRRNKFRIGNAK